MEPNLGMPSGSEVESATLHVPVSEALVVVDPMPSTRGLRGRLDALKSRGLEKIHDVQHRLSDRGMTMKRSMAGRSSSIKRSLAERQSKMTTQMQSSMSNNPMKWAGIAAGSGFAVGMIGRLISHRNKHHRPTLDIVVIDAMC